MLLGRLTKQPAERQNYYVRYSEYLQEGEVLMSVTGTIDVAGELYMVGPTIMPNEQDVEFWLEGGVAGNSYNVEITVITSIGNIKQDEFKVKVKEV